MYEGPNLEVGTYNLLINAPGFSAAERTGVVVQVGTELVIDIQWTVARSEETVTPISQAANVDLATSKAGGVDNGQVIRDLPLNGRDWTTLATLQPGVSSVTTQNPPGLNVQRANRGLGTMMAVSGLRPQQTSYWLDGINLNHIPPVFVADGAPQRVRAAHALISR